MFIANMIMRKLSVALALLAVGLLVLGVPRAQAATGMNIEVEYAYGEGRYHRAAVSGSYAYIPTDGGLAVINIATPAQPVVETVLRDYSGRDAAVSGSYLYVAGGYSGLQIFSLVNPANPARVGGVYLNRLFASIKVAGNYAYVLDQSDGALRIYDISTPSSPAQVGYYNTPGYCWDLALSGSIVAIADETNGLRLVDVSNPANPVLAGFFSVAFAAGVDAAGSLLYVADNHQGLKVVDISNPASPVQVGALAYTGSIYDVTVAGTKAYLSQTGDGVRVIDISTPSAPVELGHVDTPGSALASVVTGSHLLVTDMFRGLRILDVMNAAQPAEVGYVDTIRFAEDFALVDNYLYVADRDMGFRIIDMAASGGYRQVGFLNTPGDPLGVTCVGDYAYVADLSGLCVVNIANKTAPFQAGYFNASVVRKIKVVGNLAYVANSAAGLRIMDISTPAAPVSLGLCDTPGAAFDMEVAGNYAYVADQGGGVRIINVSNPAAPVEAAYYDTPDESYGLCLAGNLLYVADDSSGVQILNVANPAAPVLVGSYNTPGHARDVVVDGNCAYVADEDGGVRVLDVSNPAAPFEVGYTLGGYFERIAVRDGRIYAMELDTIWVLRLVSTATPTVTLTPTPTITRTPTITPTPTILWSDGFTDSDDVPPSQPGSQCPGWYDETNNPAFNAEIAYSEIHGLANVHTAGAAWGKVLSFSQDVNLSLYRTVDVQIFAITNGTVKVAVFSQANGWEEIVLSPPISTPGLYAFDIPAGTGWSGTKNMGVEIITEGEQCVALINRVRIHSFGMPGPTPTPTITPTPSPTPILWVEAFAYSDDTPPSAPGAQCPGWYDETDDDAFNAEIAYAAADGSATLATTGATWGKVLSFSQAVDLSRYRTLEVTLQSVTNGGVKVAVFSQTDGWEEHVCSGSLAAPGVYYFDIPDCTGWSGVKTMGVELIAEGASCTAVLDRIRIHAFGIPSPTPTPTATSVALWQDVFEYSDDNPPSAPGDQPPGWYDETDDGSFNAEFRYSATSGLAELVKVDGAVWGKTLSFRQDVNLSAYSVLEVTIHSISGGSLGVGVFRADPAWTEIVLGYPVKPGVYQFDLQTTGWTGTVNMGVFLYSAEGTETVVVDSVRITEAPVSGSSVRKFRPFYAPSTTAATGTPTPAATASVTPTATPRPWLDPGQARAYPNPARDRVNFAYTLNGSGKVVVDIYKFSGERVAHIVEHRDGGAGQTLTTAWEAAGVAPGIYLCRIVVTDGSGREVMNVKRKVALVK